MFSSKIEGAEPKMRSSITPATNEPMMQSPGTDKGHRDLVEYSLVAGVREDRNLVTVSNATSELLMPSKTAYLKSISTVVQDLNNVERATTTTAADINNAPMLVMNDKDHIDGYSGGGLTMFPVMNYPPLPLGQRNPQLAQSDVKHNWGCDLELASTKLSKGGHVDVSSNQDGPSSILDLNLETTGTPSLNRSRTETHPFLDLELGASSSLSSLSSQAEESSFSVEGFTPDSLRTCRNKPLSVEPFCKPLFTKAFNKPLCYVVAQNNEEVPEMDGFTPHTPRTSFKKTPSQEPYNRPLFEEIHNKQRFYVVLPNNDESPKMKMMNTITPSTSSEESIGNAGGGLLSRTASVSPPREVNCNHSCASSSMYSGPQRNRFMGMLTSDKSSFEEESSVSQSCRPCRPRVRVNGISERMTEITLHELSQYFHMPITQASKELKVGLTVLKKRCREFGIPRWPHRKMKSLESLINNIQDLAKDQGVKSSTRVMTTVRELEEQKKLMEEMPGTELADRTKRLRQACFKANYKKRRLIAPSSLTSSLSSSFSALQSLQPFSSSKSSPLSAFQALSSSSSMSESVNTTTLIPHEKHASVVLDLNHGLIASANQIGFL